MSSVLGAWESHPPVSLHLQKNTSMKMSRSISEALPSPGLSQSQSRTSTPVPQTNRRSIQREAADIANPTVEQSQNNWKSKRRIISACLMSFGNGVNDSTPGAVIPYMETGYKIGYAVVSLIFVANAVGFILAAPVTHVLERKISHSKSYAAAMSCLVIGYAIVVSEPPFPVVVITFLLYGFGLAVNLALTNAFCATLPNATVSLGYLHGAYGIGGTVAPIMATSMASNGISWSLFYTIPLAIAVLNMTLALWAFSHSEEEKPSESERTLFQSASGAMSRTQVLKKAIQNRTTLLGALFIFVYQGAEVSVSGWLVSFLISYRHGDPSRVGYVSAGFWAGITVGRLFLTYPATKLGEKTSVVLMILGAILFQLLIWLIPNLIGEFYI